MRKETFMGLPCRAPKPGQEDQVMSQRKSGFGFSRWRAAIGATATGALLFMGGAFVSPAVVEAAVTGGSGASLPYVELQAENSATTSTNGTVIGPTSVYNTLPRRGLRSQGGNPDGQPVRPVHRSLDVQLDRRPIQHPR